LDIGSRTQSLGPRLADWRDRVHHSDGDLHTAFQHIDGLYRLLHWYHALIHLALLLPFEVEKKLNGMERRCV